MIKLCTIRRPKTDRPPIIKDRYVREYPDKRKRGVDLESLFFCLLFLLAFISMGFCGVMAYKEGQTERGELYGSERSYIY